jgi:hypothetical protein
MFDREHPCQHARDVAVDQRRALAERDRRDRAGGVRPDAGHAAELGGARRQRPTEPRVDRPGAGVEVARPRVVPQARPRGEHVVERGVRERRHRREPGHPTLPVRDHRRDPGLLQHDLADPDRIRVAGAPPRQIALDLREVADHRGRDRLVAAHATSYPGPRAAAMAGLPRSPARRAFRRMVGLRDGWKAIAATEQPVKVLVAQRHDWIWRKSSVTQNEFMMTSY